MWDVRLPRSHLLPGGARFLVHLPVRALACCIAIVHRPTRAGHEAAKLLATVSSALLCKRLLSATRAHKVLLVANLRIELEVGMLLLQLVRKSCIAFSRDCLRLLSARGFDAHVEDKAVWFLVP